LSFQPPPVAPPPGAENLVSMRRWQPEPEDREPGYLPPGKDEPETERQRMRLEWFDDAVSEALNEPTNFLIKDLLDEGAMSVLYGDSNSGKTFVVLDMAYAVSTGMEFNGKDTRRGLVIYVAAEGGGKIRRRIAALRERYKAETPNPPLFALIRHPIDLRSSDADTKELIEKVREAEALCGIPASWVIIDTLSRAMSGGDENSPKDMGTIVLAADRIRAATKAHFTFVHHSGKDQARGARGHSCLRAATDTEIEIGKGEFSVTKQRDYECGLRLSFELQDIQIGVDAKSATVHWGAEPIARQSDKTDKSGKIPATSRLLFSTIDEVIGDHGETIRPFHDGPVVRAAREDTIRRAYYARIAEMPKEGETHAQLANRQRNTFNHAVKRGLDRRELVAAEINGERMIWRASG